MGWGRTRMDQPMGVVMASCHLDLGMTRGNFLEMVAMAVEGVVTTAKTTRMADRPLDLPVNASSYLLRATFVAGENSSELSYASTWYS